MQTFKYEQCRTCYKNFLYPQICLYQTTAGTTIMSIGMLKSVIKCTIMKLTIAVDCISVQTRCENFQIE